MTKPQVSLSCRPLQSQKTCFLARITAQLHSKQTPVLYLLTELNAAVTRVYHGIGDFSIPPLRLPLTAAKVIKQQETVAHVQLPSIGTESVGVCLIPMRVTDYVRLDNVKMQGHVAAVPR